MYSVCYKIKWPKNAEKDNMGVGSQVLRSLPRPPHSKNRCDATAPVFHILGKAGWIVLKFGVWVLVRDTLVMHFTLLTGGLQLHVCMQGCGVDEFQVTLTPTPA